MIIKKTAFLGILLIFFSLPGSAQKYAPGEEEAPESLFSTEIGDAEVDLLFLGSWDLSLTGSLGLSYNIEEQQLQTATFPGMSTGVQFQQIPDLTISLWLLQRYFFETTIVEDSEFNTFLLGYKGREEEFLESVRIGNTEIAMDRYGFLSISDPPKNSLGAYTRMASDTTEHEILIRYDPSETRQVDFIGKKEVTVTDISLPDYLDGQYFILPDAEIDAAVVYIEDREGPFTASDGRTYRTAANTEAVVNFDTGTVLFKTPYPGRVAVFYTKDGKSVGDAGLGEGFLPGTDGDYIDISEDTSDFSWSSAFLGQNMSDYRIDLDGETALLLQKPGMFSPFQMCNTYSFASEAENDENQISGRLLPKDDPKKKGKTIPVEVYPAEEVLSIFYENIRRRDVRNRYPFAETYPEAYGPAKDKKSTAYREFLEIQMLKETEGYFLETDAIGGSVRIAINGKEEHRFTFDRETGEITFPFMIFPDDRISIRYKAAADTRGGNINLGFGNRFSLLPGLFLDAGLGVIWNVVDGAYSTEPEESPGSLLLTAGIDYEKNNFRAGFETGVSFSTPDTRGLYRIAGMEGSGYFFGISETNIFPASLPSVPIGPAGALTADRGGRGALIYKNYRSYNFFTGTRLMPYTWTPPDSNVFPYESGSKTGPYTARTEGDGAESTVMVLEYSLSPDRPWAGGQVTVSAEPEGIDLGAAESISFFCRGEDIDESTRFFLHAGALSEDLDGDSVLDKEDSKDSSGFDFNDPASGNVFLLGAGPEGGPNNRLDSEDVNNDGLLDEDIEELILRKEIPTPGEEWELIDITLTDGDRLKLSATKGFRILVYSEADEQVSGKLIVGGISVESSSLSASATSPGTVTTREIYEFQTGGSAGDYLTSVFPEVEQDFHADGSSQKILEISWRDIPPEGTWQCITYTGEIPLDHYKAASFYVKYPEDLDNEEEQLYVDLIDADGKGLHITLSAVGDGKWHHVEADKMTNTLYIDGEIAEDAELAYEAPGAHATKLIISGTGSREGKVYVDEFHLRDSVPSVGAGAAGEIEWRYPETIIAVADFPLLSNFRVYQMVSASTEQFASGFVYERENGTARSLTETDITVGIFRISLEGDLLFSPPELYVSGGHFISFPEQLQFLSLADAYKENNTSGGNNFTKTNTLTLSVPKGVLINCSQEAAAYSEILAQSWKTSAATRFPIPFSMDGNLQLHKTSEEFSRYYDNYFTNWGNSYGYFVPWSGYEFPDLQWDTGIALSLSTTPVGATLSQNLGAFQTGKSLRIQKNTGEFNAAVPVVFQAETPFAWSITPGYSRNFSVSEAVSFGMGFPETFSSFGNSYRSQRYFYAGIPYYELFDNSTTESFISATGGYEAGYFYPEASLSAARKSGSHVYDLFLPSEAGIAFGRELERELLNISDTFLWKFHLRNTALNLFGRLGVYPILQFYETEEISTIIDLAFALNNNFSVTDVEMTVQNLFFIQGGGNWDISLENRIDFLYAGEEEDQFSTSDTVKLGFTWKVPAKFTLPIEFIKEENRTSLFFQSSETIETALGPAFPGESSGIDMSVIVAHETKLVVPQTGFLAASLTIGFDKSSPYMWYLGMQGKIEGKISF